MIDVEVVLAGGPQDFAEVRWLMMSGAHHDLGCDLAIRGADRYGWRPATARDPKLVRARKAWFEEHWPAQAGRMRGSALACSANYEDDTLELGRVPYLASLGGCSVAWHPHGRTVDGHGRLSRNYDFSIGTLDEYMATFLANGPVAGPVARPIPKQLPMTARPYVIETYPETGYATLLVRAYDLLSGCLDGMNSAGLVVALLADRDAVGARATGEPCVGVNELELPHYLLETCSNVDEALKALSTLEHYVSMIPCHFMIADRTGTSVVWEPFSSKGAAVVPGGGRTQVVTNHQLTRFPSATDLPDEAGEGRTYHRLRALAERVSDGVLDPRQIAEAAAAVRFPMASDGLMVRTLWNAQYDVESLALDIEFYLGDDGDSLRYSPRQRLELNRERFAVSRNAA